MKTTKMKKSANILACSMLLFLSSCEQNDLFEKVKGKALSIINTIGTPYITLYQGALKIDSGSSINIGEAAIAGPGNSIIFTVQNTGNVNLGLIGTPVPVSVSGAGAADYTITQPATIFVAPGGSVPFSVNFVPSVSGTRDATLTIQNDDPYGDPFIINLSGNGLVPMLVVHGNGSNKTSIYDPSKNVFTAGPNLSVNVNAGGFSFTIPSGMYTGQQLILHADAARTTTVYNPATGSATPGPTLNNVIGWGAHSFPISGGRVLIVSAGGTLNTNIYDPAPPHSFLNGPALSGLPPLDKADKGSHSIYDAGRGTWIIVHGGASTATTEFDLALETTANGPGALVGISNVDDGSHSFTSSNSRIIMIYGTGSNETALYTPGGALQGVFSLWTPLLAGNSGPGANTFMIMSGAQAGKNLLIQGGSAYMTSLYNPGPPLPDTFQLGPDLPIALGPPASSGSHNYQVNGGAFSGWTMVILGGNMPQTALYDPINNQFIPGPVLTGNAGAGANSFPAR